MSILNIALYPIAAIWGGLWWRLRGGAFTAMTGLDPGTGGMRAIAAVGLGAPLAFYSWHLLVVIPVLWLTWAMAGWGAFQGMGDETAVEEKNQIAHLLETVRQNKYFIDIVGMAIEGAFCVLCISIAPAIYLHHYWLIAYGALVGTAFAPLYFIAQHSPWKPDFGKFAKAGSEWGEVLVGMLVAAWVIVILSA